MSAMLAYSCNWSVLWRLPHLCLACGGSLLTTIVILGGGSHTTTASTRPQASSPCLSYCWRPPWAS